MTQAIGRINTTYAYHPANQVSDLNLPTEVVAHYMTVRPGPLRGDYSSLEFSLKTEGVQSPLRIATLALLLAPLTLATSKVLPSLPPVKAKVKKPLALETV